MTFSLDTPSAATLKAEAKALRAERALQGNPLGQGAALEEIARRHGYRDWNTASAAMPERAVSPVQVGQRVKGTYLSQPFIGMVIGVQLLADMNHYEVTVKFDRPVNVSKSELFSAYLPPACARRLWICTASRPRAPAMASHRCGFMRE
jgi:hypothetical protein